MISAKRLQRLETDKLIFSSIQGRWGGHGTDQWVLAIYNFLQG